MIIPTELSDIIKIGPGHKYIRDNLYEKFLVDFLGKYDLGLYGPPFEWKKLQLEKSPQLMFSF